MSGENYWEHWYDIVEGEELRQGDILRDLCVFMFPVDLRRPRESPATGDLIPIKANWNVGDWIVLSASCDVVRPKHYLQTLIARILSATPKHLGVFDGDEEKVRERVEVLRKGLDPSKFLLAECPILSPPFPASFVQYKVHTALPTQYLTEDATRRRRLRLKSPIREQFGAWVGGRIARVGIEDQAQIPALPIRTSDAGIQATVQFEPESDVTTVEKEPTPWTRSIFRLLVGVFRRR